MRQLKVGTPAAAARSRARQLIRSEPTAAMRYGLGSGASSRAWSRVPDPDASTTTFLTGPGSAESEGDGAKVTGRSPSGGNGNRRGTAGGWAIRRHGRVQGNRPALNSRTRTEGRIRVTHVSPGHTGRSP